ncbi:hypothetical protein RSOLAG1IB_09868 [Rhizoctonia solani AG-1 IB]|uniref:Uncharacterized protein n=1 Tax=Thanatephorus cucumeris (strain AG1-IB / isolate 7/3/14) TaxID=1108050 RepID=A0A0B7FU55_THACB|nr:hypothetical protein RSOLAG1IB_09868 [Rhizoctonia solani AG-1 IB]
MSPAHSHIGSIPSNSSHQTIRAATACHFLIGVFFWILGLGKTTRPYQSGIGLGWYLYTGWSPPVFLLLSRNSTVRMGNVELPTDTYQRKTPRCLFLRFGACMRLFITPNIHHCQAHNPLFGYTRPAIELKSRGICIYRDRRPVRGGAHTGRCRMTLSAYLVIF